MAKESVKWPSLCNLTHRESDGRAIGSYSADVSNCTDGNVTNPYIPKYVC
jgi:hypothetical protein